MRTIHDTFLDFSRSLLALISVIISTFTVRNGRALRVAMTIEQMTIGGGKAVQSCLDFSASQSLFKTSRNLLFFIIFCVSLRTSHMCLATRTKYSLATVDEKLLQWKTRKPIKMKFFLLLFGFREKLTFRERFTRMACLMSSTFVLSSLSAQKAFLEVIAWRLIVASLWSGETTSVLSFKSSDRLLSARAKLHL